MVVPDLHQHSWDQPAAIRNLVGVSFGFACLASLCAVVSLFNCFGDGRMPRFMQMAVCLASAISSGCMIAALAVGNSNDTLEWFRKWGTFGPALCAVASLLASFAAVVYIATRRNDENGSDPASFEVRR